MPSEEYLELVQREAAIQAEKDRVAALEAENAELRRENEELRSEIKGCSGGHF